MATVTGTSRERGESPNSTVDSCESSSYTGSKERSVDERRMRREIANSNERKRMQSINAGFETLKTLLPNHQIGEKMSKAAILQQTVDLVHRLQMEMSRMGSVLQRFKETKECSGKCGQECVPFDASSKRKLEDMIDGDSENPKINLPLITEVNDSDEFGPQTEENMTDCIFDHESLTQRIILLRQELDKERRARLRLEEDGRRRKLDSPTCQECRKKLREREQTLQFNSSLDQSGDLPSSPEVVDEDEVEVDDVAPKEALNTSSGTNKGSHLTANKNRGVSAAAVANLACFASQQQQQQQQIPFTTSMYHPALLNSFQSQATFNAQQIRRNDSNASMAGGNNNNNNAQSNSPTMPQYILAGHPALYNFAASQSLSQQPIQQPPSNAGAQQVPNSSNAFTVLSSQNSSNNSGAPGVQVAPASVAAAAQLLAMPSFSTQQQAFQYIQSPLQSVNAGQQNSSGPISHYVPTTNQQDLYAAAVLVQQQQRQAAMEAVAAAAAAAANVTQQPVEDCLNNNENNRSPAKCAGLNTLLEAIHHIESVESTAAKAKENSSAHSDSGYSDELATYTPQKKRVKPSSHSSGTGLLNGVCKSSKKISAKC